MRSIKIFLVLFGLIAWSKSFGQVPGSFSYQAVAWGQSRYVINNQSVSLRISILEGSIFGLPVYTEIHETITNKYGLVNLEVGNGQVSSGDFSEIDWGNDSYFLKVEMNANGGTGYKDMGTTQLLAVPFALFTQDVENVNDGDADPGNELISNLTLEDDTLYIEDKNKYIADLSSLKGTDSQDLLLSGDVLSIEGGQGSIDLSQYIEDEDPDPVNEIQTLLAENDSLKISGGNSIKFISATDLDSDTTNEIQDLQLSGDILTITMNLSPNEVNLGNYFDDTDNQTLTRSNDTLFLTNVDPVELPDESDPIFTTSASYGIGQTDTLTWNKKSEFDGNYYSLANRPDLSGYLLKENDSLGEFVLDAGNEKITNLADPQYKQDASTKAYIDSIMALIQVLQEGVTDIDGNKYKVVVIGDQVWMAENLKVSKYPDGTPILDIYPVFSYVGGYRWYEADLNSDGQTDSKDSLSYVTNYGFMYSWEAIMHGYTSSTENPSGIQGVCPDGWHLPSHDEWTELTDYVGSGPGTKLKLGGNTGFNARLGGHHFGVYASGYFNYFDELGWYWSCTMWASDEPYHRIFYRSSSGVGDMLNTAHAYKWNHMSVRCVKD